MSSYIACLPIQAFNFETAIELNYYVITSKDNSQMKTNHNNTRRSDINASLRYVPKSSLHFRTSRSSNPGL